MDPRVEQYLAEQEEKTKKRAQAYRAKVLKAAHLTNDMETECSLDEFEQAPEEARGVRVIDGEEHYYRISKVPLDVTDEEFAAIEKTVTLGKADEPEVYNQRSGSSIFFMVLAYVLWIGGLIVSFISAYHHYDMQGYGSYTVFSIEAFLSSYVICIIGGAFCAAASELFKKLQTIVNLLRSK